jgi:hypothetical protein
VLKVYGVFGFYICLFVCLFGMEWGAGMYFVVDRILMRFACRVTWGVNCRLSFNVAASWCAVGLFFEFVLGLGVLFVWRPLDWAEKLRVIHLLSGGKYDE